MVPVRECQEREIVVRHEYSQASEKSLVGTQSAATRRQDKKIREAPDGYVDPARYRGKDGHKRKKKMSGKLSPGRRKERLAERAASSPVVYDPETAQPTYSEEEKFALMYLCIQSSVKVVSLNEQIPERTLYAWMRQVGGIEKIRSFVASQAEVSFYNLINETAQEIRLRLNDASSEELFETFRKMMDVADRAGIAAPERVSGRGREAGGDPGHPQGNVPGITLNFNSPPDKDDKPKDEEDKVSVFDE